MSEINNATTTQWDPAFTHDDVALSPSEMIWKLHGENRRWQNIMHGLSSVRISRKEYISAFITVAFYVW